jgi:hypothetical protein
LEDRTASIIRVKRMSKLGTTSADTSNYSNLRKQLVFLRSALQLLETTDVVSGSSTLFTLMIETIFVSETSLLTTVKQRHITEDGILLV